MEGVSSGRGPFGDSGSAGDSGSSGDVGSFAGEPFGEDDDPELTAAAEELATGLLTDALASRTRKDRRQARLVARMLEDPGALEFVLALTDEVMRVRDDRRAAEILGSLAGGGLPDRFLGPVDRALLRSGVAVSRRVPSVVMPLLRARVRSELAPFVVDSEPKVLARHLARRRAEGARVNVNLLGEAVLGESEAGARAAAVIGLLQRPDVDCVSVKVSSVCAQLNMAAFGAEVERVADRLRPIYEAAISASPPKMVNLDMEQYRDLDLTVAVFRRVMDEPRYAGLDAGIVLQAYIPESLRAFDELISWARTRHRSKGGAIKVRIVKGANLAMEVVEAELAGWPPAPLATKAEVDAHYKRLLDRAFRPENAGALRIGAASHNLLELSWALTLAERRGLLSMLELEMLEGMAPAQAAAVRERAGDLLLYTPVAGRRDVESSIAYLVRRFDENTGPENFLRHQFSLAPGSAQWAAEVARFRRSVADRRLPPTLSRRADPANRRDLRAGERPADPPPSHNEPDTDLAVGSNRTWASDLMRPLEELGITVVPAMVAGRTIADLPLVEGRDPSDPSSVAYRWCDAGPDLVDVAVSAAGVAGQRWRETPADVRRRTLHAAGDAFAAERGRLIAIMARDAGKIFAEADTEVSEAVDFARYYAAGLGTLVDRERAGADFEPYSTVLVIPPWNFPLAIPAGGTLAALAAGAAVILKPAPESVATAWALAEACWRAGVPRDVLQFFPCLDGDASRGLVCHEGVDAVILTGSWDTARMFSGWRPDLHLHAETSGKNALVVTGSADLELAVVDLVRSAFGHSGQKCSAASLAILEASVYDDPRFMRQLADAVRTLRPGPAWDLRTTLGPVIRPPSGPLLDALTRLDPGETWLVAPRQVGGNPNLWSPGVKLGVQPGSTFHMTECFGPVLGVMRAADLEEAIYWQNQVPYGLTAGIAALDPSEISYWRERAQAGNLYVNRHTTGAVVGRQPFGGWKRSVVGPGTKTGGPNYVPSLGRWRAKSADDAGSFAAKVAEACRGELAPADAAGLAAEANTLRHLPLPSVLLRVGVGVGGEDVARAVAVGRALGLALEVSAAAPADELRPATFETDAQLSARVARRRPDKVRVLGQVSDELRLAVLDAGIWLDDIPLSTDPLAEALRWVREQTVTETMHRHGDLTARRASLRPGIPPGFQGLVRVGGPPSSRR
jgi:RHH-type proline utilization regulon transcriptional repressor/proline dehydrogenase/delta 1-pyrroline-5-carboxylate dehydrogenase